MRIVVFSDSHRDIESMLHVVDKAAPDMIIHLGDLIYDAVEVSRKFIEIPIEMVKGNCDLGSAASSYKMITIEGKKIFMTHGDVFSVRTSTSDLVAEGKKLGADLILYGHTHRPVLKKKKGIQLMNPGSIGKYSRGPWHPSFGVIEINSKIECSLVNYDNFLSIEE